MLIPIILSGGFGQRLWPLSRVGFPKQFLCLGDELSLLQKTLKRAQVLAGDGKSILVANELHRALITKQLASMEGSVDVLFEPVAQNTGPAIISACLHALRCDEEAMVVIMPIDHTIPDEPYLIDQIHRAAELAGQERIFTLGITPDYPESGYGYIQPGKEIAPGAYLVDGFIEKPPRDQASALIAAGNTFWNSGLFICGAKLLLEEFRQHAPELYTVAMKLFAADESVQQVQTFEKALYQQFPNIAFDRAVMEKSDKVAMLEFTTPWRDIGSWDALWDIMPKESNGNVLQGDVVAHGAKNSYIHGTDKLVAVLGIEDTIVIDTPDALLVANKAKAQGMVELVQSLVAERRQEVSTHLEVQKPWGSYKNLAATENYLVKTLIVNPGEILSLQRHQHRSEHWVVVQGTAEVTLNDDVHTLIRDQSIAIPLGAKHRVKNSGDAVLIIVETQIGEVISEDDIERFEDKYDR